MRTHWICLGIPPRTAPCGERGTYQQAMSGDSGAAAKHGRETGHSTVAGLDEAALERMFGAAADDCSWCDANKHDRCKGADGCACGCNEKEEP